MSARRSASGSISFLAVLLLLAGLWIRVAQTPLAASGLLRVTFLDVGQGDAILIDAPNGEHILVDGGPGDALRSALPPLLPHPERFRLMVATHNDADHIGGLPEAIADYPTEMVWLTGAIHTTETYRRWLEAIRAAGATAQVVQAGEELVIDGLTLTALSPLRDFTGVRPEEQNDAMIVLKLTYGATSFLLTGDIDTAQEEALIAHDAAALGSTVVKVPHHGSRYGSSAEFLAAVHPSFAVISVGAENRYGHPTDETLTRYAAAGIPLYRTDEHGWIRLLSNGTTLWLETAHEPRRILVDVPALTPPVAEPIPVTP